MTHNREFEDRYVLIATTVGRLVRKLYYQALAGGEVSEDVKSLLGINIPLSALWEMLRFGEQSFLFSEKVWDFLTDIPLEDTGEIAWPYPAFWLQFPKGLEGGTSIALGCLVIEKYLLPEATLGRFPKEKQELIKKYADRVVIGYYKGNPLAMQMLFREINEEVFASKYGGIIDIFEDGVASILSFLPKNPMDAELMKLLHEEPLPKLFRDFATEQSRVAYQFGLWMDSDQKKDVELLCTAPVRRMKKVAGRSSDPYQEVQLDHFSPTITKIGGKLEKTLELIEKQKAEWEESQKKVPIGERQPPKAHVVRSHWKRVRFGKRWEESERRLILTFPRGLGEYAPRIYKVTHP